MAVTVCVPTHRGRLRHVSELLASLLIAARAVDVPVEIIVVDDSPEPEFQELRRRCSQLGVRHLRGPRAVGAKRNLAVQAASHDLLLFVDSDCMATPELIAGHLDALAGAPADVAGVAGATIWSGERTPLWQVLDFSRLYQNAADVATRYTQVGWATTSNLCVRRDVFTRLGGFDEGVFTVVGGEDVDLGVRACDHGYRWLTCARAAVLHQRDAVGRWSQVLAKQFTYGRADVFLSSRHRHRRTWRANPVAISLMSMVFAVVGVRVGLPPWALLAGAVPVLVALLRTGPQPVRRWGGALVDLAFDAGITWEALRQGRPASAVCTFVYTDDREFRPRRAASRV
ncbi:glycosyltransferase family 2 protein [Catellatospora chokoriensis]|uniref:glycosyltransferase family 2 protein n=1 Tax=Catellatospora chokoriensis TaxID=310353 RepID=UPI00177D8EF9|nr:glycosyltransferase [Catellatospora chokoriensis]